MTFLVTITDLADSQQWTYILIVTAADSFDRQERSANHKSWGAEMLRKSSPSTMCHMSCVTCYVSSVTCHMLCVRCQVKLISFLFLNKVRELVTGGSVINWAYPVYFFSAFSFFLQSKVAIFCHTQSTIIFDIVPDHD